MAEKNISVSDGDRFINMGNGNIQHLDQEGNLKSAIFEGQVYSAQELSDPAASRSVIDNQREQTKPNTIENQAARSQSLPSGAAASQTAMDGQKGKPQSLPSGAAASQTAMDGQKVKSNPVPGHTPTMAASAKSAVDKFNSEHDKVAIFTNAGVVSRKDDKGMSNYQFLTNQGASEARAREFCNSIGDKNVATITGDGKGGFIARDDQNIIIGGMDQDGAMSMDKIDNNIFQNNSSRGYGEVLSPSWGDEDTGVSAMHWNSSFEGVQKYTEAAGCTPSVQRQLASEASKENSTLDLSFTAPVALGSGGKDIAFVSRDTGEAVVYVKGNTVATGDTAQKIFDKQMETHGPNLKKNIMDRINKRDNKGSAKKKQGA